MTADQAIFESREGRSWLVKKLTKPIDLVEHQDLVRDHLERLLEAFLFQKKGQAAKLTAQLSAKLLATSTTTSLLMGTAALFGTASTGTAISTLSGAALTKAALAWWGGSVASGLAIVGGASLTAGFIAVPLASFGWRRFISGKERKEEKLTEREFRIKRGIETALVALSSERLDDDLSFLMLWREMIVPLVTELEDLQTTHQYKKWPLKDRLNLKKAISALNKLRKKTNRRLRGSVTFSVSHFGAFLYKVYADSTEWSEEDLLVMEAFARSTVDLDDNSTPEEIGEYLRGYSDGASRDGLLANIKGIYHELAFAHQENTDGDDWYVELAESTTNPGIDAFLVNRRTGDKIPIQLKASDTYSTSEAHYADYSDIPVFGTTEIADVSKNITSTGFSNAALTEQVASTAEKLASEGTLTDSFQDTATLASTSAFIAMTVMFGEALRNGYSLDSGAKAALKSGKQAFGFAAMSALINELGVI